MTFPEALQFDESILNQVVIKNIDIDRLDRLGAFDICFVIHRELLAPLINAIDQFFVMNLLVFLRIFHSCFNFLQSLLDHICKDVLAQFTHQNCSRKMQM